MFTARLLWEDGETWWGKSCKARWCLQVVFDIQTTLSKSKNVSCNHRRTGSFCSESGLNNKYRYNLLKGFLWFFVGEHSTWLVVHYHTVGNYGRPMHLQRAPVSWWRQVCGTSVVTPACAVVGASAALEKSWSKTESLKTMRSVHRSHCLCFSRCISDSWCFFMVFLFLVNSRTEEGCPSLTCYGQLVKQSAFQVHTAKLHAVRVLEECTEACMHRLPLCRQISKHTDTTEVKLLWRAHSADPPWLRGCAEKALVTTAKRWHRPW